jgi:hypothetical protein
VGNIHQSSIADIWNDSNILARVRQQNYAAGSMIKNLDGVGRSIGFCPGLATNQTGTTTGMYPDAGLKLVFFEDLHRFDSLT